MRLMKNIAHYYYCGAKACQIGPLHRLLFFSSVYNFVISASLSIIFTFNTFLWMENTASCFMFQFFRCCCWNIRLILQRKQKRYILKRPNCPLSRVRKIEIPFSIMTNHFINVFQTFHLSAIFRKFDQFTDDHSPENSQLRQKKHIE